MTEEILSTLSALIEETQGRSGNEAETRHRIIDFVLHDVLTWPRNRIKVEEFIQPGFADYVLVKQDGSHLLFIEAKREGVYFQLPIPHANGETSCYMSIGKLLTDVNVKSAMTQVRTYCIDTGCEYRRASR
jgi:predicted type IV restriction endonuclease